MDFLKTRASRLTQATNHSEAKASHATTKRSGMSSPHIRARTFRLGLLAAILAGVALVALGVVSLPSVSEVIEDAPETLGQGTYAFGAAMAFLEFSTLVGVVVIFEVGVVLSGAIAGQGEIDFLPLVAGVWVCATAGEAVNFWLGRRFGRPFLERHGPRYRITPERLTALESFFQRRGSVSVFVGRFIPLVRSSMPFVAGTSAMAWRTFVPLSVIGNAGWAALFAGLGYAFYTSADEVAEIVTDVGFLAFAVISLGTVAVTLIRRRRRRRVEASPK